MVYVESAQLMHMKLMEIATALLVGSPWQEIHAQKHPALTQTWLGTLQQTIANANKAISGFMENVKLLLNALQMLTGTVLNVCVTMVSSWWMDTVRIWDNTIIVHQILISMELIASVSKIITQSMDNALNVLSAPNGRDHLVVNHA